jgi:diguanylate cyclase (GGDEF)-like protein
MTEEKQPALQVPSAASLHELRGALERLERRNWWLWGVMVAVLLLLAGALATFSLPAVLGQKDPDYEFQVGLALRGLLGMVLLFSTYAVYQQLLNRRLRRQLADQIEAMAQLQVRAEEFHQMAMLDPLTGLYNRRVAEEHLTAEISRSGRHDYDLTLLSIDLDGMKEINDNLGHAAGDLALRVFSNRLKKAIRSSDLAARMGGDEFIVILPECHAELVPRVLARLSETEVEYGGKRFPVVFSAGWVGYQSGERADQFLERADQALYANKRTGKVEEQVAKAQADMRQAQKLQTVGRLAGSVAHDFNNLLMLIKGYCELLLDHTPPDSPSRKHLMEIQKASERANTLTRQLLSFARNQAIELRVLDLNEVLLGMESMLRRLAGAGTEVVIAPGGTGAAIKADQGQLEQVLLNLAVNARDAMPEGGRLAIETSEVTLDAAFTETHRGARPGDYILLRVSDTGVGMDAETRARAFEPYFTTKENSGGTGLGLTTVYGIVKQGGGYVWVESEPKRGTTVSVYWPRLPAEAARVEAPGEKVAAGDGPETVLVVEDEEALRNLAREYLQSSGYHVLLASSGTEALSVADKHAGPIHVLLTDVVMPGMTGWELAKLLTIRHPEIHVVYMSGYTDDAVVRRGLLDPSVVFLQKPFTLEALSHKLREVMRTDAKV